MTWIDEYLQLVDDCEVRESRLTDWERNFLDSISRHLNSPHPIPLSTKQTETLDKIWERVTSKG